MKPLKLIYFAALLTMISCGERTIVLKKMKDSARYMYENVSNQGGFLWSYSEDLQQKWGELQAFENQIWVERSTPAMGNLMLDAYHATHDEQFYLYALQTGKALIAGQLSCGGWNYKIDFDGEESEKRWYDTIGFNAWGSSEHSFYYGNATFDDNVTTGASEFLLRLYLEKKDSLVKVALDKATDMIIESQYDFGLWPQRWPLMYNHPNSDGSPDYTSCYTLNDDVTINNINYLEKVAYYLKDKRADEACLRAKRALMEIRTENPNAGWADQFYLDKTPAKARDFEPAAISSKMTRDCIRLMCRFYSESGDSSYLRVLPPAVEFLEKSSLSKEDIIKSGKEVPEGSILCPRFIEQDTGLPLYLHRKGKHVFNGTYYIDQNLDNVIGHYASVVVIDICNLKKDIDKCCYSGHRNNEKFPDFFTKDISTASHEQAADAIESLDCFGRWITILKWHPNRYVGPGSSSDPVPVLYSDTVGDPHNTSDTSGQTIKGIETSVFIKNFSALIYEYLN